MSTIAAGVYTPGALELEVLEDGDLYGNRSLAIEVVLRRIEDYGRRLASGEDLLSVYLDYRQWTDDMAEVGWEHVPLWDEMICADSREQWFHELYEWVGTPCPDWEIYIEDLVAGTDDYVIAAAEYLGPYCSGIELASRLLESSPSIELLLLLDLHRDAVHVLKSPYLQDCQGLPVGSEDAILENSADPLEVGDVLTYVLPAELALGILQDDLEY